MSSNLKFSKTCEHCNGSFIAQKLSTRYCSHQCASKAYKIRKREVQINEAIQTEAKKIGISEKSLNRSNPIQNDSTTLYMQPLLTLIDVARIFSVNRSTAYRICIDGKLNWIRMNKKMYVRRQDIDDLFEKKDSTEVNVSSVNSAAKLEKPKRLDGEEHKPAIKKVNKPLKSLPLEPKKEPAICITDFYSAGELSEKYGYTKSAIHKMAASRNIPKIVKNGCYLYSKTHFDSEFAYKSVDDTITKWYSVEDIMSKYAIPSKSTVYTLVSDNKVTKKNQNGKTLYAQSEIDELMQARMGDTSITEWYSYDEITELFGFEKEYIPNFVHRNQIPRKRSNGKSMCSKVHFDKAIEERKPITEYITTEQAMKLYGVTRDALYVTVKRHDVPKKNINNTLRLQKVALEAIYNPTKLYI